jgi:hypothetical protein
MDGPVIVEVSGPLFDGRLDRAIQAGLDDGLEATARKGVNLVRHAMRGSFRNPTGNAERRVVTNRAGSSRVIHDAVIYGAWLEGTSSRNATTRFKGYRSFRRATQQLDGKMTGIVDRAISDRTAGL